MLNPTEELSFWLGIMEDHAEIFLLTLSYREDELIKKAAHYKEQFSQYEIQSKDITAKGNSSFSPNFITNVMAILLDFISFKRQLLRKLLKCQIEINLPPTFVNHQINEAMEFYRSLCIIMSNEKVNPVSESILLHKIWLPDAAGHAASISGGLDPTEYLLIKQADEFKNIFEHLSIKATELGMELDRAELSDGSLTYLNEEVENKITEFICYLDKIKDLRSKCKALSFLNPLLPDHMAREEIYYLSNIKKASKAE